MEPKSIFIVTGLSGSGKSTVIATFEDAGYYCVDNLPVAMLPQLLNLPIEDRSRFNGFVFVMDLREQGFLSSYPEIFKTVRDRGYQLTVLFLEAEEKILLRRYSQTRRVHHLARGQDLIKGIRLEKKLLKGLRKEADNVIDTSHYNVHELKYVIMGIVERNIDKTTMRIKVLSFGFKHGLPLEADLVMDVRFLPNPYFVPALKEKSGEDQSVYDYVTNAEATKTFMDQYKRFLDHLVPCYHKEGKAYLTVAIGCTGGRHRSVAIARSIYHHLSAQEKSVEIAHRDINL